nr:MAG TPA: hypothetical protein [Caudoviricetes sp.]
MSAIVSILLALFQFITTDNFIISPMVMLTN